MFAYVSVFLSLSNSENETFSLCIVIVAMIFPKLQASKADFGHSTVSTSLDWPHLQKALIDSGGGGETLKSAMDSQSWDFRSLFTGARICKDSETDFYKPPVLGGAGVFDNSAPTVYKNPVPQGP